VNAGNDATRTSVQARADFAPGTVLGGRYRVESILGIGGMGVVYRASDLALGVPVALKLLRAELAHRQDLLERFRQELLLARQVSSPQVVRIHDLAQHDGHWLISMDYVDGEALDRRIDRDGPMDVEAALGIARQVAQGLAAAHAKGVVHRDLKPANILLDTQGNAYISDFGVARSLASSGLSQAGLTGMGAVVGTPDYLSPEQARGETVDGRSDLYALGLILYEMLTGKLPFSGGTLAETMAQRMVRAPESIDVARPGLPRWLARLVDRLLRSQPSHRLQHAGDVVTAIDQRALARDLRPRRGAWMAVAAVLVLAVGAVGLWQWRLRTPAAPVAVASAPLDRLLVLPLAGSGDAARDAALAAHLRQALAANPGFAVVDEDRTVQALRQVDPTGNGSPDADVLRREATARRILRPRLARRGARWTIEAQLLGEGSAAPVSLTGPAAAAPAAALRAWLADAAVRQVLGLADAALEPALPASSEALDAYGAGLLARRTGQLDAALRDFAAATQAQPDYPGAWLARSRVAQDMGAQEQALDAAIQGQNAAARAPQALQRSLAAQRALLEGDAPTAAAQWRARLQATPDDTEAELNLARALSAGGDFDGALQALETLTGRDAGDPRAWFELGKLSILRGQARVAVDDYLTRALVGFKRSRDLYGEAETVNALGVGYGRLGQTGDAAEQYAKAIELRRKLGNQRGVATSLRNLANTLSLTGDFAGADKALQEARALNIALGDRAGHAAVDNELGLLAEERGDYPAALAAFRGALQGWQQVADAHGSAEALNNIGFAHYQLGSYGDAQVYWQQASDAYAALGDTTGEVRTRQNLGLLATARGRWADARQQLQSALQQSARQQMPEEAAVSRRNLAELDLLQGRLQSALAQAGQAEAAFRQRDDVRGRTDAALLRAEGYLGAGALQQAGEVLDAVDVELARASLEQQAIAKLLRSRVAGARGDARAAAAALRDAQRAAQASGVRQLQLRIALEQAQGNAARLEALDAPTAALGHAALRLAWLREHMRAALRRDDPAAAVAAYREATGLLRGADAPFAPQLHALGARARRLASDAAGADAAQARATQARAAQRDAMPEDLRRGYDMALADADALPAP
jgi:tetratricopeptide (TPR) repeat protein